MPGLDEAVLLVPEVARDVRAGELRVRREAPVPKNKRPAHGLTARAAAVGIIAAGRALITLFVHERSG